MGNQVNIRCPHPHGAAVPWAYFVETIFAEQVEEGTVCLK